MSISYSWRGHFTNEEVNKLHAEAFRHEVLEDDWWAQVNQHSLGWVCAEEGGCLLGFVNVAWDGGVHAFLLDTMVRLDRRARGVGTRLVSLAVQKTRLTQCEWLHVDCEDHLANFYFKRCGFRSTKAGLIALRR